MSDTTGPVGLWFKEYLTPHDVYQRCICEIVAHKKTHYQELLIVDIGTFGKALVLDGQWQSSTGDEFLYHEPLVHPACVNHGGPKRVLILGAGEGAALREVLKWNTVEQVVTVDLDREVVEACQHYLGEMHRGSFDDPRAELVIEDAFSYVDAFEDYWDVIIHDLSDPVEDGPSYKLFTKEYFEKCRRALAPGGLFTLQADSVLHLDMQIHVRLVKTIQAVFAHSVSYSAYIPTFGEPWGFIMASQVPINHLPDPTQIDALIARQTSGQFRMFDGSTLLGLMQTPKYLREAIAAETKIYTLAAPPQVAPGDRDG